MNTFDKIDLVLKKKQIKQIDLTNFLGVSKAIYSSWKSGRTDSYYKFIPQIAKFLNVSTDYLLLGEESISSTVFSDEEQRLILAYRNQTEEGKKMVRKLLDMEEPTNRVIDDVSDPNTDLETAVTSAFTKTSISKLQ